MLRRVPCSNSRRTPRRVMYNMCLLLLGDSILEMKARCAAGEGDVCFPWIQLLDEFDVLVLNTGAHTVASFEKFEYHTY